MYDVILIINVYYPKTRPQFVRYIDRIFTFVSEYEIILNVNYYNEQSPIKIL